MIFFGLNPQGRCRVAHRLQPFSHGCRGIAPSANLVRPARSLVSGCGAAGRSFIPSVRSVQRVAVRFVRSDRSVVLFVRACNLQARQPGHITQIGISCLCALCSEKTKPKKGTLFVFPIFFMV